MSKLFQASMLTVILTVMTLGCTQKGTVSAPTGQPSQDEKEKLMKQYTSGKQPTETGMPSAAPSGESK